jgi:hypothetical protein
MSDDSARVPGASPLPVDVALSRQVAKAFHSRTKACYRNAYTVVTSVAWARDEQDERLGPALQDALYVEGLVVADGIMPIPHGWVETPRAIVDPTLVLPPRRIRKSTGDEPCDLDGYLYFPGPRLTSLEIAHLLCERKSWPLTFDRWPAPPDLAWIRAWEAAHSFAQGRPVPWGSWATDGWAERVRTEAEHRARLDSLLRPDGSGAKEATR